MTHWPLPSNDTATIQLVQTLSALAELGVAVELFSPRRPWHRPRPPELLRQALAAHYGAPCRLLPRELPSLLPPAVLSRILLASLAAARTPHDAVLHTRELEVAWTGLVAGRSVLFEAFRPWTRESALHRRVMLRVAARRHFLGVVCHSRYAAERYVADGVPADKVRVIYNGFDPAPFAQPTAPAAARAALGLPEGPTVVFLGRIAGHKRVDLLLDAAERTPEIRWVLGGDAESAEAAPLVARAAGLPNVAFAGYVTGARLALLLQAGDLLVIPPSQSPLEQVGHTVLPLKLFQYLAAGRAIVTGEVADTAELLEQGRNALRVRPDDPAALASAVRELVADPARRARLGDAARRDAAAFTWQARAETLRDYLFERLGR